MLNLENNKVQIREQYHYRKYFVLSYLMRQDKWSFKVWCWRASDVQYFCVTAGKLQWRRYWLFALWIFRQEGILVIYIF